MRFAMLFVSAFLLANCTSCAVKGCLPELPNQVSTKKIGGGHLPPSYSNKASPGLYKIEVTSEIQVTKNNGNPWDIGTKRQRRPDPEGRITIGRKRFWLSLRKDRYSASWSPGIIQVKGDEEVKLWLRDRDWRKHDFIGQSERSIALIMNFDLGQGTALVKLIPVRN